MEKVSNKHQTATDVYTALGNVHYCEFSDLENEYREITLATEPTLKKAKELLNKIHHDGYADEMCKDWDFDGKFGKYWDGVRYEEMYFRFDKPKYVA